MTISCVFGMDPDYAKPISPAAENSPQDSTDSPEGRPSGQRDVHPSDQRRGGLNPEGSRSQAPDGAAGGAAQGAQTAECIHNVYNAWPKQ